jgi:hypothetical protein
MLKMKTISILAIAGLVLALAPAASADTLLEDTFSNGNTKDGWVERIADLGTAPTFGYDGVATIVPGHAQPSSLWHNFSDTVLQPGETLTLSFDIMMSKTGARNTDIRFGLGYSSTPLVDGSNPTIPVDGYMSSAPFLGSDFNPLSYWLVGPINWGNASTAAYTPGALDDNDLYTINNSEMRTVQYRISRNGSVLTGETYVNGAWSAPVTYTDIIADFKFNAVGLIASYSDGETFTYDNVKVEVATPVTLVDTDSAVTGNVHTDEPNPGDFSFVDTVGGTGRNDGIYSYSYDAGASFDMLVISVSHEGNAAYSAKYDGVSMVLATGNGSGTGASIFYLATSAQSGTIELDFTGDGNDNNNGIGLGIAAIACADPNPIALIDADFGTGPSITIDPTVAGSFSLFAVENNQSGHSGLNTAPLTQIYSSNDYGSSAGGASYDLDVAAGSITYSYTTGASRSVAAANFAPVAATSTTPGTLIYGK